MGRKRRNVSQRFADEHASEFDGKQDITRWLKAEEQRQKRDEDERRDRDGERRCVLAGICEQVGQVDPGILAAAVERDRATAKRFLATPAPATPTQALGSRMRAGTSRIYQQHLLKELKAGVRRKFASMDAPIDLQAALQAEDFFAFDDACTAPLNGFGTAGRYYRECSSRAFLGAIRVPTLILHAADDPFMSPAVIPEASELAPAVTLEVASHGGHVGFVGADAWGLPMLWLEQRIPAAVAEFCDQGIRPSLTATAAEQA